MCFPTFNKKPAPFLMMALVAVLSELPGRALAIEQKTIDEKMLAQGETIYRQRCRACHDKPTGRIPSRDSLAEKTVESVMVALEIGAMKAMASGMSNEEIQAVATYLTGEQPSSWAPPAIKACEQPGETVVIAAHDWPTVGKNIEGSRYQAHSVINGDNLDKLNLKWAFAVADGVTGGAVVAGGRVYLASGNGQVLSLDAESGCSYWHFEAKRLVRMVTVAPLSDNNHQTAVFFGDDQGNVAALDAEAGTKLWTTNVESHPLVRITAPPSVVNGQVFVPVSSMEDPRTHDPDYACCTFRGSVVSLNAGTGEILWKSHTIIEETKPVASINGVKRYSPAGASVFTPLGLDAKRGLVYAATAESYTDENPAGAYSVIAFDMKTGAHVWERQFLPSAADRPAVCEEIGYTDCRNMFSMSTQVMLHTLPSGKEILLAGQKWGYMYGLDPDNNGEVIWKTKVSRGGDLGGVMYGFSADQHALYVSISDIDYGADESKATVQPGGLVALQIATGEILWKRPPVAAQCSWGEKNCSSAQVSATTAIPGAVFSGAWDGHMRAYSTQDGSLLWDIDTAIPRDGVNDSKVNGGRIGGYAVTVTNGLVFIVSGSNTIEKPGNALLVYSLKKQ